ncbi:hypothetical protein [Bradyrhizobium sp. Tv2a-2]|uniref:hypothetical protein n=1 Tax=Bradyrhizobium sp. Tv2a-2 TaxID=113395 RepID=UPI00041F9716|nr:hypothetical protein [Bradyrhizobium sp. Tv2a-2]
MNKMIAMTALGLSLISSAAVAAERTTDAAIGAVSGAVVFGPIGAVAGALVGYSAGPSISHSWSSGRARAAHQRTKTNAQEARASASANQQTAGDRMSAPSPVTAPPSSAQATTANTSTANTGAPGAPPVQTLE